jgi:hypothetical protein
MEQDWKRESRTEDLHCTLSQLQVVVSACADEQVILRHSANQARRRLRLAGITAS